MAPPMCGWPCVADKDASGVAVRRQLVAPVGRGRRRPHCLLVPALHGPLGPRSPGTGQVASRPATG